MKAALFALALLGAACGGTEVDVRAAAAGWEIEADGRRAHCSNNRNLEVENFPSGWRCHFRCAEYDGAPHEVWVALPVADGRWVQMPDVEREVQVSPCWGDAPCPEGFPCE